MFRCSFLQGFIFQLLFLHFFKYKGISPLFSKSKKQCSSSSETTKQTISESSSIEVQKLFSPMLTLVRVPLLALSFFPTKVCLGESLGILTSPSFLGNLENVSENTFFCPQNTYLIIRLYFSTKVLQHKTLWVLTLSKV